VTSKLGRVHRQEHAATAHHHIVPSAQLNYTIPLGFEFARKRRNALDSSNFAYCAFVVDAERVRNVLDPRPGTPKLLHSDRNASNEDRNQDTDHQDAKMVAVLHRVSLEEDTYEVDRRQGCQTYGLKHVATVGSIGQVCLVKHHEEQGNQGRSRDGHRRFC
jgi:hypothetical protein